MKDKYTFKIIYDKCFDIKQCAELLINKNFVDIKFLGFSRIDGNPIFMLITDKVFIRKIKLKFLDKKFVNIFYNGKGFLGDKIKDFYSGYNIKIKDIELVSMI